MDFLKKITDACRSHYEKLLLSLVLLGLAGAVVYLSKIKSDEDEKIKEFLRQGVGTKKVAGVNPVDLSANDAALRLITNPPPLNFSLPHHLFNPVKWQRRPPPDTTLIKLVTGYEVGWGKMSVTRITPLNFIIALQRVPTPGSYYIEVTHEGAARPADRKPKPRFATTNSALNEFFKLIEIKGPPEEPTGLVLELADGVTKTEIAKDKPFTKVEGYEADLKYSIDGKAFNNLRLNSHIRFQGEDSIVIAITANEVVVSARSNDKKI